MAFRSGRPSLTNFVIRSLTGATIASITLSTVDTLILGDLGDRLAVLELLHERAAVHPERLRSRIELGAHRVAQTRVATVVTGRASLVDELRDRIARLGFIATVVHGRRDHCVDHLVQVDGLLLRDLSDGLPAAQLRREVLDAQSQRVGGRLERTIARSGRRRGFLLCALLRARDTGDTEHRAGNTATGHGRGHHDRGDESTNSHD